MIANEWWPRPLIECMKEASKLIECSRTHSEPNVEDFDKAKTLYEECCQAYDLKEISFDFGKSLRARQAHKRA